MEYTLHEEYVEDLNGNQSYFDHFGLLEVAVDCVGCSDCTDCENCVNCHNCK